MASFTGGFESTFCAAMRRLLPGGPARGGRGRRNVRDGGGRSSRFAFPCGFSLGEVPNEAYTVGGVVLLHEDYP